jgi:hypothetical protein
MQMEQKSLQHTVPCPPAASSTFNPHPLKCPCFAGTSLSGLALLKYTPLGPVSVDLTIRPAPTKGFNADVFKSDLALFLNCSFLQVFAFCNTLYNPVTQRAHQISLGSIVTSTRALVSTSVHLPQLPAQSPLYRAAGDVTLTATFAESPFLAANIAPAVLAQVCCKPSTARGGSNVEKTLTNFKSVPVPLTRFTNRI